MAAKILFTERQRFTQWWLWLLLIGISSFIVYKLLQEFQTAQPFSDTYRNIGIGFSLLVLVGVMVLFLLLRLDTQITETGISVRFFPFHFRFLHFAWPELQQVYVRQYNPITEYGGWGLRFGIFGSGKAYNVSGDQGIQLVFKNGKKLLIGTNKPEEAATVLKQVLPPEISASEQD